MSGTLYLVATPIGNLEDITFRAVRVLKEADIVACEDTRQTLKLLNRYDLKKNLISFYESREKQRIPHLLNLLQSGRSIALVTDAGTPGISDPGFRLVREAVRLNIPVVPVPGPAAVTAALAASGLPTHRFLFMGFAPVKKESLRKTLLSVREEEGTIIFYLPARKIGSFLEALRDSFEDRPVVIAREMTKIYEEFLRGTPAELLEIAKTREFKGEVTVLIQGAGK
ncbi:MAG: 16S rRNA (cytidine(1402)-2'-O)-methyltransferase [Candidatus Aminicenantes bacterium]|nr:16S rRNA (cytidine(1402)-2'-O)-methyltransferase [Candidatus Aminicenantes bacterium]